MSMESWRIVVGFRQRSDSGLGVVLRRVLSSGEVQPAIRGSWDDFMNPSAEGYPA
jgi:hypothetical protein